jgi:hypothetical protein
VDFASFRQVFLLEPVMIGPNIVNVFKKGQKAGHVRSWVDLVLDGSCCSLDAWA